MHIPTINNERSLLRRTWCLELVFFNDTVSSLRSKQGMFFNRVYCATAFAPAYPSPGVDTPGYQYLTHFGVSNKDVHQNATIPLLLRYYFQQSQVSKFAVRRKVWWPVKVARAGESGNGFEWGFRHVGQQEQNHDEGGRITLT